MKVWARVLCWIGWHEVYAPNYSVVECPVCHKKGILTPIGEIIDDQ